MSIAEIKWGVLFFLMNIKTFKEGEVEILAHAGEITKKLPVFYNPLMAFDRDLSVAVLRAHGEKDLSYCDVLAGGGIRGMRALKESGHVSDLILNDCNPEAVKLIKRNLKKNNLRAQVFNKDSSLLLREYRCNKFDVIDIDPFGSFISILDSALRAVKRKKGLLFLTATDSAPLCGTSVKASIRKYDAKSLRTSYCKEIGLRILIGAAVRMCVRYEITLKPLFSYNRRHYFRLFLETSGGIKRADEALSKLSYLQHCFKCEYRAYVKIPNFQEKCPNCGGRLDWAGPMWASGIADRGFCNKILKEDNQKEIGNLVERVKDDAKINIPFYDIHRLSEVHKTISPKRDFLINKIREAGYGAVETHFIGTGFRSDAPIDEISKGFEERNPL